MDLNPYCHDVWLKQRLNACNELSVACFSASQCWSPYLHLKFHTPFITLIQLLATRMSTISFTYDGNQMNCFKPHVIQNYFLIYLKINNSLVSSLRSSASSQDVLFTNGSSYNDCIMVPPQLDFIVLCVPFLYPLTHR